MNTGRKKTIADGMMAIAVILFYGVISALLIKYTKSDDYAIRFVACFFLYFMLFIILKVGKKIYADLGIKLEKLPITSVLLITIVCGGYDIINRGNHCLLLWVYYTVAVAGLEELYFRGLGQKKLEQFLGGKTFAIVVLGVIYGIFHSIRPVIQEHYPLIEMFNYIGMGILGHCFFLWIYQYTQNIINAILLHAALDAAKHMPFVLPIGIIYIVIILCSQVMKKHREHERVN